MHLINLIKSHKLRAIKTLFACLGHLCIGLQGGIIGPSLLDLSVLVTCEFDQITYMVTGRFTGYAIGAIAAGFIAKKTNPQAVICLTLLVAALFHFAMPLTHSLNVILTCITLTGFANGISDTTLNMFILKLWAKECPPFLQALHSCFGLGSLIAPVIVRPFLKESEESIDIDIPKLNTNHIGNESIAMTNNTGLTPGDILLVYPYFMISIFTTSISLCFMFMFIKYRDTTDHPSRNEKGVGIANGTAVKKSIRPKVQMTVIAMTSVFAFMYVGLETEIGTFIPAYSHQGSLGVSKKTGALMSSAYWLFFTFFRLFAIILSSVFGSTSILTMNLINSIIGCVLMLVSQHSITLFWIACIYVGIGESSTWGSLFGYIESNFTITPTIVTCFNVGACLGASVLPAIVGYLIDIDPQLFVYFNLVFAIAVAVVFLGIFTTCKKCLFSFDRRENFEKNLKINGLSPKEWQK